MELEITGYFFGEILLRIESSPSPILSMKWPQTALILPVSMMEVSTDMHSMLLREGVTLILIFHVHILGLPDKFCPGRLTVIWNISFDLLDFLKSGT